VRRSYFVAFLSASRPAPGGDCEAGTELETEPLVVVTNRVDDNPNVHFEEMIAPNADTCVPGHEDLPDEGHCAAAAARNDRAAQQIAAIVKRLSGIAVDSSCPRDRRRVDSQRAQDLVELVVARAQDDRDSRRASRGMIEPGGGRLNVRP
jgi:hypothetical protein